MEPNYGKSLGNEIKRNFESFYIFGDLSTVKRDLVGKNPLTYEAGSPSIFNGKYGKGEYFGRDKMLVNRSIANNVTGYPFFLYGCAQVSDDPTNDNTIMSLSPWLSNFSRQAIIYVQGLSEYSGRGEFTDGGFLSVSYKSKAHTSRVYSIAMVVRSGTSFNVFVNGEALSPQSALATGFTTKNSIMIGGPSNGAGFLGGIFFAGWGTKDPGNDFCRRISQNPMAVIYNTRDKYAHASVPSSTIATRRTITGTRAGSRQETK
jgi:hypothetical protein